jgi:hypothetical protein
MPKRKRRREGSGTEAGSTAANAPVDPAVALFAQRHKEERERQKAEQRAEAERRKHEADHQRLIAEKDAAVAKVKELRRRDRVPPGAAAEADAAYKAALAALIEFETGAPPPWAATDAPPPDVDSDPATEPDEP